MSYGLDTDPSIPGIISDLTKREYAAIAAMQGLFQTGFGSTKTKETITFDLDQVSTASVKAADALLAELDRTEE